MLKLLTIGRGNADIALVLGIGQSTVATHVHNLLVKTRLREPHRSRGIRGPTGPARAMTRWVN